MNNLFITNREYKSKLKQIFIAVLAMKLTNWLTDVEIKLMPSRYIGILIIVHYSPVTTKKFPSSIMYVYEY